METRSPGPNKIPVLSQGNPASRRADRAWQKDTTLQLTIIQFAGITFPGASRPAFSFDSAIRPHTGAVLPTKTTAMNLHFRFLAALLLTTSLAGCAGPGPYRNTLNGAAIGGAGGALLGYAYDGGRGHGALAGGALGAAAGGATGYYLDQRDRPQAPAYGYQPGYQSGYQPQPYREPGHGHRRHHHRDHDRD